MGRRGNDMYKYHEVKRMTHLRKWKKYKVAGGRE